jgi:PAS domain S-box-containing protein
MAQSKMDRHPCAFHSRIQLWRCNTSPDQEILVAAGDRPERLPAIKLPQGSRQGDNEMDTMPQSSAEHQQTSQYARSLIEASLDPLVTISPEGKITDVNEATIKVTGRQREQLIGTDFSDYFTEPENARRGYEQVFSKGFVTDYPLTIRQRDGSLTHVVYNASVYRDEKGNVLGVFAAARDVTAQKEAEIADQRAREEQRAQELERLAELERFQKLTVGRELKMIALKKEIEELKREVGHLRPARSPERASV